MFELYAIGALCHNWDHELTDESNEHTHKSEPAAVFANMYVKDDHQCQTKHR